MTDAPVATSVLPTDQVQIIRDNAVLLAPAGMLADCMSFALSGSLPVATLQLGTVPVIVPVPGLLAADRVAVEPAADLPAGLVLAWAHPAADGVLTVALTAGAVVAIKAPIALSVTALR